MQMMTISLLRGICQMPAYVAADKGYFRQADLDVRIEIQPTAWIVPERMIRGEVQFSVIPWTRIAAAKTKGEGLALVCGSGHEEAAVVVRRGIEPDEVRTVAVPQRGGMKDLTANGLMRSLGWTDRKMIRLPSGDGAILSLLGHGADAASMVEPYATMLEDLGIGKVIKRTGDVWPGAPGCSLATTERLLEDDPELVRRVVACFVRGAEFVEQHPAEAAEIAEGYIGVSARFIRSALQNNRPQVDALANTEAMESVLKLMVDLGYIDRLPADYLHLQHLQAATER